MMTKKLIVVILVMFAGQYLNAQEALSRPSRYQFFNNDSLIGFDEDLARRSAIHDGFLGDEFAFRMNQMKREFINNKYHIWPKQNTNPGWNAKPTVQAGCLNEDFEASTAGAITASNQILGWTVTGGSHTLNTSPSPNSCNLLGCCPFAPSEADLISAGSTGYIDPGSVGIGAVYPIYSVFGSSPAPSNANVVNPQITQQMMGDKFIRINSNNNNWSLTKLSKTFSVTAQNSLFQFAFISVFATGHDCCSAGAFKINLSNATTNSVITCPNFTVSAPSSQCIPGPGADTPEYFVCATNPALTYTYSSNGGSNGSYIYNRWRVSSIDLTAYIGQNITIDIIASDCTAGGHFGYIYFDAQCGPMTINGNGVDFPAGSTNVVVPTCGAAGATICAPAGLGPYAWQGPNVGANYAAFSPTNQCFVSNVTETYTLLMNPAGSCAPIQKVVQSTVTPAPLLSASAVQAQCGQTLAIVSVTPSGSAAVPSSLTWSPTPLTLNTSTTVGTYQIPGGTNPTTVTVKATDPLGCFVTATAAVYPAPPIPTFTIQNLTGQFSITCITPSVTLSAANNYTYQNHQLDYYWATPSSTYITQNIDVTSPGNVTITIKDPVTNCVVTKTTAVFANTVAPTATVAPLSQSISCVSTPGPFTLNAITPSINVKHTVYNPSSIGGYIEFTQPTVPFNVTAPGTYTDVITNLINGCTTVRMFSVTTADNFPTFNLTSSPLNFTLGCGSKSTAVVSIVNGAVGGGGGGVTYTVFSPPGVNPPSNPGGQYTISTAATYTAMVKAISGGCETRVQFSVLDNKFGPPISLVEIPYNILTCTNPSVVLNAKSDSTNVGYQWNKGGPTGIVQSNSVVVTTTANPTQTLIANYTLSIQDLNNTCISTSIVPMYQNLFAPSPTIAASTLSLSCLVSKIILTGQHKSTSPGGIFPNTGAVSALWEGPSPQEPLAYSTTYTAQVPGIYTVTAQDIDNGCTKTSTIQIIDYIKYPTLEPAPDQIKDCGSFSVTLTPTLTSLLSDPYSYTWSPSANTGSTNLKSFVVTNPGEYNLKVRNDKTGCESLQDWTVKNGSINIALDADQSQGFAPFVVTFSNTSSSSDPVTGTYSITSYWNYGNQSTATITAANAASVKTTTALYDQPGSYTVTMWAIKGTCSGSAQKVIIVDAPSRLEVPNIFTPNGDGINDIYWLKTTSLADLHFTVFDRWGHLVYELNTTKGQVSWDGKNQMGKECAEGIYFYTLTATGKDGMSYDKKGNITLTR